MVVQHAGAGAAVSGASSGCQLSSEQLTVTCLAPLPLKLQHLILTEVATLASFGNTSAFITQGIGPSPMLNPDKFIFLIIKKIFQKYSCSLANKFEIFRYSTGAVAISVKQRPAMKIRTAANGTQAMFSTACWLMYGWKTENTNNTWREY